VIIPTNRFDTISLMDAKRRQDQKDIEGVVQVWDIHECG
jgi:hypothetical protein